MEKNMETTLQELGSLVSREYRGNIEHCISQ